MIHMEPEGGGFMLASQFPEPRQENQVAEERQAPAATGDEL